jgi:gliding motility-associated-like protein
MHRQLLGGLASLILILGLPYCSLAQNGGQPITICSGASIVIKGDAVTPTPSSYLWELLQNGAWGNAPGANNGADYPPGALTNNTSAPIIFSIRRQTIISGNPSYDSNYDVTVLPSATITSNTITPPLVTTFCSPGNPATISGSIPAGGNGTFTYQWQSSTDNITFSNITGAASTDYTPGTLLVTTYFRRVTFGSSCVAPSVSNVVTITVFPNVSNNVITAPATSSFCTPSDPSVITGNTPTGGTGAYTYQWQSSTDNVNFTDIPGAIAKDYDPPLLSATTYYRRTAISGICWVPVNSNVTTISILTAPVNNVITAPAVASFCLAGDPAVISGNTPSGGNGVYTYKWQSSTDNVNFTDIAGATAKDYDPPVISVTTYYRRTVVSGSCATPIISNSLAISIVAPPSTPLTVPVVTVCPGNPATLSVTNPQNGITYNWYDSAAKTNLLFTGTTYTTAPIAVSTTFYVESSNGSCASPSAATVQVNLSPAPTAPVLTTNPVNTCSGTSATLSISNPQPGVSYNWYPLATGGSLIFTGTTFTTPVLTVNTTYYVEATNGSGCTSSRTLATITVLPVPPPLTGNSITAPAVTSLCSAGDPANIAGNIPSGGNNTYNYQWQQSTDNVTFTNIPGAIAKDYDPPVISVTTYYRRTVISGACTTPITSNIVTINIVTPPTTPLAVQPVTICPGNPAVLSVTSPQNGITYKWYDSAARTNLLFTGTTYTTGPVAASTTFYVESSNGLCASPSTATAQVNVTAAPTAPVLTTNPVSTCNGTSATLSISNPQPGVTYNWYPSPTGGSLIFTGTTFTTPVLAAGTTYYVEATNGGGCTSSRTAATVTVLPVMPPLAGNSITAPAVTSLCSAGDPANIAGNIPSGGNNTYNYQWQQSTDNITFTNIPGAIAKDYDPPVISVTTYYRRTVVSGVCTTPITSNIVTINVVTPPTTPLAVQPVTVCPGNPAVLSVTSPQNGITYKWYDSAARTNLLFTGTTYTTGPVAASTTFYVESSNGLCASPSTATAQVNVTAAPTAPVLTTNPVSTCNGTSATLSISNPQPGVTYNWYPSATGGSLIFTGNIYTTPNLSVNTSYYVEAINAGGCSSARTAANVTILPVLPPLADNNIVAPAIVGFCLAGDPANIAGSTPSGGNNTYGYQWQQSTDNITFIDIAGANAQDYDPPAITATTYYRRTASSGVCTTPLISNVITITVLPPPIVPPTVQPIVIVCPGNPAILAVTGPQNGFIYNWYDSPAKTNLLFTGTSYTTQPLMANKTFYVESSNGLCSGSSTATIQVNMTTPPTAPLLVQDTVTNCGGSVATFSVVNPQAGFTYIWYSSATGGTPLNTGTTFITPALLANTIYYLDATNTQGCTSLNRTPATANAIPPPQFSVQDASVCPGSGASLFANTSDRNITFTWFTTATGGSPVSTGDTLSIPIVTSTIGYYVEATNNVTGCISPSRKFVQAQLLQQLPAPVAGVDSVTTFSVTFGWRAIKGASGYLVSTDSGQSYTPPSSGSTGLSHTVLALKQNQVVTLVVKAVGNSGCQQSANSAAVTGQALNQTDDVYVANAFTPNGDGNNDVVYIHSEAIKTFNFYVYTQWGQMIFSTADKSVGWDGTFKGAKEPFGVYTYYVKAVMNNGHEVNKKGTITLLK